MLERRLILSLTIAICVPIALLGLLLPTPTQAIDHSTASMFINGIDQFYCTPYLSYTRTPNTNDQGSGYDYYRITIVDNTGKLLLAHTARAAINSGTVTEGVSATLSYAPAPGASSITAYFYDQTTYSSSDGNGPLLAQSSPFGPLPSVCTTIILTPGTPNPVSAGGGSTGGVSINPPDNRTLAYIRVNTSVYSSPNLGSAQVATLTAGQSWFVTTRDSSGQFWQVFIGGPNLGWVRASDVSVAGASSAPIVAVPAVPVIPPKYGAPAVPPKYIPPAAPVAQTVPSGSMAGIVRSSRLHLHLAPSLSSPTVAIANGGEVYVILGRTAGRAWVKVSGPSGSGWINSTYLIMNVSLSRIPVIG